MEEGPASIEMAEQSLGDIGILEEPENLDIKNLDTLGDMDDEIRRHVNLERAALKVRDSELKDLVM